MSGGDRFELFGAHLFSSNATPNANGLPNNALEPSVPMRS